MRELSEKASEIIADSVSLVVYLNYFFISILKERVTKLIPIQKRHGLGSKFNIVDKKRVLLKEGLLDNKRKHLKDDKFHVTLVNFRNSFDIRFFLHNFS